MSEQKQEKFNIKDWIVLSTTMIGIVLTILALIWQNIPSNGIVVSTFMLMISFILFVNSVSANSKAKFEVKFKESDMDKIKKFVRFAEYSFGLGFTFVIIAFTFLGYKYLIDFVGKNYLTLSLPIVFLLSAWILILIYNSINYSEKGFKILRSLKRNIWMLLELIALVIIILDFFEIFTIP
ncbi:MAG: hypothetical protein GF317_24105 [Candidatus Lokiarchaeota archaeon]|nr:hypothetical protein [Candidatus Lokiarchaeota archaeon]MBD3202457.1 hypothetical protein [Candidatus Lokiarchaeota archaeon]